LRAATPFAAVLLAACGAAPSNRAEPPPPRTAPSGLELVALTIEGRGRSHVFAVEVARSAAQQEQGLMNRRSLAQDAGMLFPFDPPHPASFWMHNTLIPLDMIFIRPDGSIARIAADAVPMSEAHIEVSEPVTAVLEIAGGRATQLGLRQGDRVSWAD
jgi:uncharacterized membrane protein (UPF0127 family)